MQLNPSYGTEPVIVLDGDPAAVAAPAIRQRRRLAATLAQLTDQQWAHPSRCDGWSSRDVIVHLDSTNSFWAYTIAAGVGGERTELLATFDPVASPADMVAASQDKTPSEVLDQFVASTDALVELWAGLDAASWTALAEAPPGHISISAVTHHAIWDSWIHERDILLPLGISPAEEPDEVAASLRYAAALGPAIGRNLGGDRRGSVAIQATEPDIAFAVTIGDQVAVAPVHAAVDLQLSGGAVHLLEAFSRRVPLDQDIPDDRAWMLGGLSEIFDEIDN